MMERTLFSVRNPGASAAGASIVKTLLTNRKAITYNATRLYRFNEVKQ